MKKAFFIILLLCVVALIASPMFGSDVARSVAMRESLQKTDRVFIYEGLPHQSLEPEQLATELKRDDVQKMAGHTFYTPPTEVPKDGLEALKQWITEEDSYRDFSGEKKCGGFHPDYAIVWKGKKRDYAVLLSFGCNEVIFTDGSRQLRYDLNVEVKTELQKWLVDYAKKRPTSI